MVVVTHANGFPEKGVQELTEEKRKELGRKILLSIDKLITILKSI